jgi:hypothetical protein
MRTEHFVKQPTEYTAFVPAPLPHAFSPYLAPFEEEGRAPARLR